MGAGLRVHQGGSGEPVLLLLHGLGIKVAWTEEELDRARAAARLPLAVHLAG